MRRASEMAREVGQSMAVDTEALNEFLPEILITSSWSRAPDFGVGLAEGAEDLDASWSVLRVAFVAVDPQQRNPTVLGNFLRGAEARNPAFVAKILDAIPEDPDLLDHFAFLQGVAGLDRRGIDRLVRALERETDVGRFGHLSNISTDTLDAEDLVRLIDALATKSGGVALALDLLWRRFYAGPGDATPSYEPVLVLCGRRLMAALEIDDLNDLRSYSLRYVIAASLTGADGAEAARAVCTMVYDAFQASDGWRRENHGFVDALFEAQPELALDIFVDGPQGPARRLFGAVISHTSPLISLAPSVIADWADLQPDRRYARLGECVSLFQEDRAGTDQGLSPMFLTLVDRAPNKSELIGDIYDRLHPRSWSGSLAEILERRKSMLDDLPDHPDILAWRTSVLPHLDRWISAERQREIEREESFE